MGESAEIVEARAVADEPSRFAHAVVNHFRNLRRNPHRQALTRRVIGRDHDKRFERRRAVAVDFEIFLDHAVGGFERGVGTNAGGEDSRNRVHMRPIDQDKPVAGTGIGHRGIV